MTLSFPNIPPSRQTWRLVTPSSISPQSPFDGTAQRLSWPGARWACTLDFPPLHDGAHRVLAARSRLKAFLTECRGHEVDFYLHDRGSPTRGTAAPANVVTNGYFDRDVAGWSNDGSTLSWSEGWAFLRATGTARLWQQLTVENGATYRVRATIRRGVMAAANNPSLRVGTTLHGQELVAAINATDQYTQIDTSFVASGTDAFLEVRAATTAGNQAYFTALEVSREGLVAGASQTGTILDTDGWPAGGADNYLRTADLFEVAGELKRLVAAAHVSSAAARLLFEPALRASPADNAPITVYRPRGRFFLATPAAEWEDRINRSSGFSVECIEAIE